MIYKVSITDNESTLLDTIEINTNEMNWNSQSERRSLGHEIIDEIELTEHIHFKEKIERDGLDKH